MLHASFLHDGRFRPVHAHSDCVCCQDAHVSDTLCREGVSRPLHVSYMRAQPEQAINAECAFAHVKLRKTSSGVCAVYLQSTHGSCYMQPQREAVPFEVQLWVSEFTRLGVWV